MMDSDNPWRSYDDEKPDVLKIYEWSVPHVTFTDMRAMFLEKYISRLAGNEYVKYPRFSRWNGYEIITPEGVMWRHTRSVPENWGKHRITSIEGVNLSPCPFCKSVPEFHGIKRLKNGFTEICAPAYEINMWWLECCAWAKTPHMKDPRVLADKREKLLKI